MLKAILMTAGMLAVGIVVWRTLQRIDPPTDDDGDEDARDDSRQG
ncbi:MAG: hypothetical protein ACYTGR_15175 [Planctomycetota bacterium]